MQRICLVIILLMSLPLCAQIRKELQTLESKYASGALNEVADLLPGVKATNNDERAFLAHLGANLKKNKAEALSLHERAAERYPQNLYGQKSALEAAKIYVLDRDFTNAKKHLVKIDSAQLPERFYWAAVANLGADEYSAAISNSENFLRLSPNSELAENALHLVSDAYIAQAKYHSAIANLDKIKRLQNYDKQYYYYKLGNCHEASDKQNDAIQAYKDAYLLDRYSQIAYQVEERLFAMRDRRPSLDLSFLYPYNPLEPVDTKPETSTENKPQEGSKSPATEELASAPIKLIAKPQSGIFLQAGRFSVESNARRLSQKIREMQIPAAYYLEMHQGKESWVVLAGPFADKDASAIARASLTEVEINSFIVRY